VRAEAKHLVAQRRNGYLFGFFAPLAPFFPRRRQQHQPAMMKNSIAIGAVHERFVFEFSFETNCVESHFLDVTKFGFAARFITRSIMSGAQPPPRIKIGLPLTLSSR